MRKELLFLALCLTSFFSIAQEEEVLDSITEKYIRIAGDTILQSSIPLEEVYIFGKLEFSNYEDKRRYYILKRKTIKVYPYAKMATEHLVELKDSLVKIKSKRKRRRYTRKIQKNIEAEFSAELKKLTRTEGQILIKLIYRQTGKTAFGLVKELRSGWRAFWYSATAKMFDIVLKEEYNPESVYEDYLIEDILQRAFANDRLKQQRSVLDYDYASLSNKWNFSEKQNK